MKNFSFKTFNGDWWRGEIKLRYNLRTLLLLLLSPLILLFLLFKAIFWLVMQAVPFIKKALIWLGKNFWKLLCFIAALFLVIWFWLCGLFKTKTSEAPKESKPISKKWLYLLLLLLLLLGGFFCLRSCAPEKEEVVAVETLDDVYQKSFDGVITTRAYLDGVQKEVSSKCPRALVGLKFINNKSVEDYNFSGMTYNQAVAVVAQDWKPLVIDNLNPSIKLSEQQMVVVTLTAMRMGRNGFPRSTFLEKVNQGDFEGATQWLLLQKSNGQIRKIGEEPQQYFYMLRLLWTGEVSVDELLDLPMFSYRAIPVNKLYHDSTHVFNQDIREMLNKGNYTTPREALELN